MDWQLLTAFIDFYKAEDSSFEINRTKLYLGLLDIYCITGLPIDGNPLSGTNYQSARQLCVEHLKCEEAVLDELVCCSGIRLSVLKNIYEVVPEDTQDVEPYVKAYHLYVLGQVVFSTKASGKVSAVYLQFLCLKDIDSYAHLHNNIAREVKNSQATLAEGILEKRNGEIPNTFPLFLGWMKTLEKIKKDNRNTKKIEDHHQYLTLVDESEIKFQSYKDCFGAEFKCDELFPTSLSRTVLHHVKKMWYHRPDIGLKQLGLEVEDLKVLPPLVQIANTQACIECWNNRYNPVIADVTMVAEEISPSSRGNRGGSSRRSSDSSPLTCQNLTNLFDFEEGDREEDDIVQLDLEQRVSACSIEQSQGVPPEASAAATAHEATEAAPATEAEGRKRKRTSRFWPFSSILVWSKTLYEEES